MRKLLFILIIIPACAFAVLPNGLYLGLQGGYVNAKNHHMKKGIHTYRVYTGYQFNKNAALEAGYASLQRNSKAREYAVDFEGRLTTYLRSPLFAFIRGGISQIKQRIHDAAYRQRSSKFVPVVGMGFGMDFAKHFATDLSLTRYLGSGEIRHVNLVMLSFSVFMPSFG